MKNDIIAIGRRKTSTANLFLIPINNIENENNFDINGKPVDEYFQNNPLFLNTIKDPLTLLELTANYKVLAKVKGGGLRGQSEAIKLALTRAVCKIDASSFRPSLKKEGLLSRDSRVKERRKYGLKKARKASQYSKR